MSKRKKQTILEKYAERILGPRFAQLLFEALRPAELKMLEFIINHDRYGGAKPVHIIETTRDNKSNAYRHLRKLLRLDLVERKFPGLITLKK